MLPTENYAGGIYTKPAKENFFDHRHQSVLRYQDGSDDREQNGDLSRQGYKLDH